MSDTFMNSEFLDTGKPVIEDMIVIGNPDYGKLDVKFKKLHEDATLPSYSTDGSAGLDCTTVTDGEDKGTYIKYKLGFSMEIPKGYVGYLFPRSSVSTTDLALSNSVGVIDSDYRGEVQARFFAKNFSPLSQTLDARTKYKYHKGDKICQLIIMPIPRVNAQWVDELSETIRGEGGHGSTGA